MAFSYFCCQSLFEPSLFSLFPCPLVAAHAHDKPRPTLCFSWEPRFLLAVAVVVVVTPTPTLSVLVQVFLTFELLDERGNLTRHLLLASKDEREDALAFTLVTISIVSSAQSSLCVASETQRDWRERRSPAAFGSST